MRKDKEKRNIVIAANKQGKATHHQTLQFQTTMSSESGIHSSESDAVDDLNLKETELTLGLPGIKTTGTKRGFLDTVDLHLGTSSSHARGTSSGNNFLCSTTKSPTPK